MSVKILGIVGFQLSKIIFQGKFGPENWILDRGRGGRQKVHIEETEGHRAPVAQSVEHRAAMWEVVSSTPAGPTLIMPCRLQSGTDSITCQH